MATAAAWRPIGHVLVEAGAITQEDLDAALVEQRRSGRRLGEILIDSGVITWLHLAHAIAEQASDLEAVPDATPVPDPTSVAVEPEPTPEPRFEPPVSPPPPGAVEPPVTARAPLAATSAPGDEAAVRLETVETMLKERQRAFLELVTVTERLRATVARLQDQLAERDAELMRVRAQKLSA